MNRLACIFAALAALSGTVAVSQGDDYANQMRTQTAAVAACSTHRYCLVPTQNLWTFLELDTQTGRIWHVQFTVNGDQPRFRLAVNADQPTGADLAPVGTFALYATQNLYNFVLVNQLTGGTWQVQWGTDKADDWVIPIHTIGGGETAEEAATLLSFVSAAERDGFTFAQIYAVGDLVIYQCGEGRIPDPKQVVGKTDADAKNATCIPASVKAH